MNEFIFSNEKNLSNKREQNQKYFIFLLIYLEKQEILISKVLKINQCEREIFLLFVERE